MNSNITSGMKNKIWQNYIIKYKKLDINISYRIL